MRFSLGSFRFFIKPRADLILPQFSGQILRGGLGWSFKNLVCIKQDRECANCLISHRCSYFQVFETPVPEGARMMRKYPFAPHPFVLTPPLGSKTRYSVGEELSFDLTLIGRAVDYLPYFIYTFEELGRRGIGRPRIPFTLARVEAVANGCAPKAEMIYDCTAGKLAGHPPTISFADLVAKAELLECGSGPVDVTLRFLTPTNIVTGGRIDHNLDFSSVMQSLLRRIKLLQHFHCPDVLHSDLTPPLTSASAGSAVPDHLAGSRPETSSLVGITAPAIERSTEPDGNGGDMTSQLTHRLLWLADQVQTIDRQLRWVGQPIPTSKLGCERET